MSEVITVRIKDHCVMRIDLEEIVKSAGAKKKDKYEGSYYTAMPVRQARKLLWLVYSWASEEDQHRMDEYLAMHPNKIGAWKK